MAKRYQAEYVSSFCPRFGSSWDNVDYLGSFDTLGELENKIRSYQPKIKKWSLSHCHEKYCLEMRIPMYHDCNWYCGSRLVLIKDEDKVVYSDGTLTNGERYIAPEIEEWFKGFMATIAEPPKICVVVHNQDGSVTRHTIPVSTKS